MKDLIKIKIKKIPYKFAFLLGLTEGVSLFFIALFDINMKISGNLSFKFFGGLLTGALTAAIIIFLMNLAFSKFKILKHLDKEVKIEYLAPIIFTGLFLAFLFTIESAVSLIINSNYGSNSIIVSLTTPLSMCLTLIIYNIQDKIKFIFNSDKRYCIKKINSLTIILISALYEILFLPFFYLFSQDTINKLLFYPVIAFAVGTISCLITILIYNLVFNKKMKEIFFIKHLK